MWVCLWSSATLLVASKVFIFSSPPPPPLSLSSQLALAEQRCVFSSLWINDRSLDTVPTLHVLFVQGSKKTTVIMDRNICRKWLSSWELGLPLSFYQEEYENTSSYYRVRVSESKRKSKNLSYWWFKLPYFIIIIMTKTRTFYTVKCSDSLGFVFVKC